MVEESSRSRLAAQLIAGSMLFAGLVGVGGCLARSYRETRLQMDAMIQADTAARAWLSSDPRLASELGNVTVTGSTGMSSDLEERQGSRTYHAPYTVMGSKGGGSVLVWLSQTPGTSWKVFGAVLTTPDQRTLRLGAPPDLPAATVKSN